MSGNDIANLVTLVFVLVIVYIGVMFRLAERQVERERSEELDRKLDALIQNAPPLADEQTDHGLASGPFRINMPKMLYILYPHRAVHRFRIQKNGFLNTLGS